MAAMKIPTRKAKSSSHTKSCRLRVRNGSSSSSSSSSSNLLLLLVLSSIACASAFPLSTSSFATGQTAFSGTTTTTTTTSSAQPSSPSALGALPGFNGNNNNKKNDGNDDKNNVGAWNPNNIFESFKNLFGNKDTANQAASFSQFFQPPGITTESYYEGLGDYDEDEEDEEDELPAGTSLLFKIKAKQLKPGGLRLFLMFYLMGMQNTPDRNTWRADQKLMSVNVSPKNLEGYDDIDDGDAEDEPEEKKYILEMLYDVDRTGMLQIELRPTNPKKPHQQGEIRIYRCGSRPSTSYLMQESVIVDGVLDELQNISGEKDLATTIPRSDGTADVGSKDGSGSGTNNHDKEPEIAAEDRLLITDPPNAIEAARESLAFS